MFKLLPIHYASLHFSNGSRPPVAAHPQPCNQQGRPAIQLRYKEAHVCSRIKPTAPHHDELVGAPAGPSLTRAPSRLYRIRSSDRGWLSGRGSFSSTQGLSIPPFPSAWTPAPELPELPELPRRHDRWGGVNAGDKSSGCDPLSGGDDRLVKHIPAKYPAEHQPSLFFCSSRCLNTLCRTVPLFLGGSLDSKSAMRSAPVLRAFFRSEEVEIWLRSILGWWGFGGQNLPYPSLSPQQNKIGFGCPELRMGMRWYSIKSYGHPACPPTFSC